jgi:hypothetical protein
MLFATTYAHAGIHMRFRKPVVDRLAIVPILGSACFEKPLIAKRVTTHPVLEVFIV